MINKRIVYRVQPAGLKLGKHRSETSAGNLDHGVHVFGSLEELYNAVRGWVSEESTPEIVTIQTTNEYVEDNGDYEGYVLIGNKGKIVERRTFADWDTMLAALVAEMESAYMTRHNYVENEHCDGQNTCRECGANDYHRPTCTLAKDE